MDRNAFDALAARVGGMPRRRVLAALLAAAVAPLARSAEDAAAGHPGQGKLGAKCKTGHQCSKGLGCDHGRCDYRQGCGYSGMSCKRKKGDCCVGFACVKKKCRRL